MAKINRMCIEVLLSFLQNNNDCYFLIGGHAVALQFERIKQESRTTKDFDIVLVTEANDSIFSEQLAKYISSGGYKNKYKNEKKTAYRFEEPEKAGYPNEIEFFAEEGKFPQSLDNHLAKLNIEINEERISAIVLNKEVYEFAKRHVEIVDGLPVVDIKGLIGLKALAYLENKRLYDEGSVTSDKYKKHRKDLFGLITILNDDSPISDVPEIIKERAKEFLLVLETAKDLAKDYGVSIDNVVNLFKKLFDIQW